MAGRMWKSTLIPRNERHPGNPEHPGCRDYFQKKTKIMLSPIVRTRLYKQVAHQIRALIKSGGYVEGQRLPSEREMVRYFGVSRNSLHQALVALESEGIIEIRNREGVFVARTIHPESVHIQHAVAWMQ